MICSILAVNGVDLSCRALGLRLIFVANVEKRTQTDNAPHFLDVLHLKLSARFTICALGLAFCVRKIMKMVAVKPPFS